MGPIASLVQDDPYLGMPLAERVALRRQRKARIRSASPPMPLLPRTYFIPNTPYGIAKIAKISFPACPIDREWWPNMWFWDLLGGHPQPAEGSSVERVLGTVAVFYGFTKLDIKSIRRHAPLARARMVAAYLAKVLTSRSLPEIGRRFGGRDHTTILHSVRKIERLLKTDEMLAAEILHLRRTLA